MSTAASEETPAPRYSMKMWEGPRFVEERTNLSWGQVSGILHHYGEDSITRIEVYKDVYRGNIKAIRPPFVLLYSATGIQTK